METSQMSTTQLFEALIDRIDRDAHVLRCIDDSYTENVKLSDKLMDASNKLKQIMKDCLR